MATIKLPAEGDLKRLDSVRDLARKHLDSNGLEHWGVVWSRAKKRAGMCDHANQALVLSAPLMSIWELEHSEDTVLHEIAHALTPGHGHDKAWKRKCVEIGADPTRTWGHNGERELHDAPWVGTCPRGHTHERYRKPRIATHQSSCGKCSRSYSDKYKITWRKR